MGEIRYPFVDPDTILFDPREPGRKLCPRCSKGGKVCCAMEPAIKFIRGPWIVVRGKPIAGVPQGECSARELWVCTGRCDENGEHHD